MRTSTSSIALESVSSDLRVKSVMSQRLIGISPDASLELALRAMTQSGVRHLPVVVKGRCLGLLHESDLLWRLWAHPGVPANAGDCSRRPAPVVDLEDDVAHAAMIIDGGGTDAAIVTERGRVVGIITATDLVRIVASVVASVAAFAEGGPR